MVVLSGLASALVAATYFSDALAHPDHKDPVLQRRALYEQTFHTKNGARSVQACSGTAASIELQKQAAVRRAATAQRLREERGLTGAPMRHRRDLVDVEKWMQVDHDRTADHDFSADTPPSEVFGTTKPCVLTPEGATGPYFVAQELLRTNIAETQPGVPLYLDWQFIDVSTCGPAADLIVDTWAANSTGQYSGVSDPTEYSGLNTTFLRGVQQTDADGVVQFTTIFPGHYWNRATHQHVLTHTGGTLLPNGTYAGGHVSHIGQLYFDASLRAVVEAAAPYNTNDLPLTTNEEDVWIGPSATDVVDPFFDYVLLGDKIEDGILAWMSMAVDGSANWDAFAGPAAFWTEDGGRDNPDGGWGGMFPTPPAKV
ncbi:hypothetical protein V496_02034 [Pseudogymnoascus sp. VKM F-4515 (FW-2607)]|nr:hypothetical protein V496_02034 [Pseudogymnoascus sp. VKM F-4515 (FW-2607)]KFY94583.1 hypothetical protein V498_03850 [Pseudogymnoascus sp. VKM F-4517 (FW-2822)]